MAEPIETCVSCGSEHSIYEEHESNNCVEVLKARLAAAEKERDDWAFRCGGAEAQRDKARAVALQAVEAKCLEVKAHWEHDYAKDAAQDCADAARSMMEGPSNGQP